MLIKSADDKSKRLALLEDLQKSNLLDAPVRKSGFALNSATRALASKANERLPSTSTLRRGPNAELNADCSSCQVPPRL